jgi:hypothetical protein
LKSAQSFQVFCVQVWPYLNPTKILNPMLGICAKVITNSGTVCGPYSQI